MQEANRKQLMARGNARIEKTEEGMITIIFEMQGKEEVNAVSIDIMELGFDMLYEPRSRAAVYESCAVCGENLFIKVVAPFTATSSDNPLGSPLPPA